MASHLDRLLKDAPILTDGAWGTELQALGLPPGESPDHWNLTHPERVEQVARAYVDAGSRVVLTNTFGANRLSLEPYGLSREARLINRRGVHISRAAAPDSVSVFASIGPTGKLLALDDGAELEIERAFHEQAESLADAGPDAVVIETMSDHQEALLALKAVKSVGLPAVVCVVFGAGKAKDRTLMGATPEKTAEALAGAGADALGVNCGTGADGMVPICRRLREAVSLPLWMKPNAGLPQWSPEGKLVYATSPEEFASAALALVEAGADFIGGCCGTGPAHIRVLKAALERRSE